ncbi:MAG TPA: glycosyltransferase [Phycisphaerae bacterium]|nr:glycosyltransferase [Phycisphaerae bacterium]
MKIAIVLDSLARGGAERQAMFAARELTRHGRDVELIYYHRIEDGYDPAIMEDTRVTYLPKDGAYWGHLLRLKNHLKRGRFDIVHGFKSSPTLYAAPAGRWAGAAVVLGGIRCEYDDTGLVRLGHRVANRMLDGWVVNSRATTESLVRELGVNPDRVFVVPNGIEPQSFQTPLSPEEAKHRLGIPPHCGVVSIFAAIRPQKNHGLFIEMASRVLKRLPHTRFLVIGDGEKRAEFERQAEVISIARSVLFLGNRADIPELLAATDISVLTSHYEGLANALLEAMAVGIPVVTTGYAGADELVSDGHEGYITPMGDAEAMAQQIIELLEDPAHRRRLGENGRRTVAARFEMPTMANNLYGVYERCFAESKRKRRASFSGATS